MRFPIIPVPSALSCSREADFRSTLPAVVTDGPSALFAVLSVLKPGIGATSASLVGDLASVGELRFFAERGGSRKSGYRQREPDQQLCLVWEDWCSRLTRWPAR